MIWWMWILFVIFVGIGWYLAWAMYRAASYEQQLPGVEDLDGTDE